MHSPIDAAIETLVQELKKQEAEVLETKRMVNNLLRRIGKPEMFGDIEDGPAHRPSASIRPDQFYGRPLATAVQEILEIRRQATPAEELMKVLLSGGFDFDSLGWRETDRLRSFTMTLAKNTKAFHRLPNGMFGLPAWYPEAMKKKHVRQTQKSGADEPNGLDEVGDSHPS
jgi:hypothetical protein